MRRLMQLKNKKGFTLVELIVVLAMIGVLTAIILPLSMNAGKPQAAVAKAKSFYFGSQRILIQYRADSPELQTGYLSYKKRRNDIYHKYRRLYVYLRKSREEQRLHRA